MKTLLQFTSSEVDSFKKILEKNYWSLKTAQESKKLDPKH